jgi:hypothetical protein
VRHCRITAAVAFALVGFATFILVVVDNDSGKSDACRQNPVYVEVFSICKDWADNRLLVVIVALVTASVAAFAAWAVSTTWPGGRSTMAEDAN